LKIAEEREKSAEEIAVLDKEDDEIAALIKDGETDFGCRQVTKYEGVVLTRPVRP